MLEMMLLTIPMAESANESLPFVELGRRLNGAMDVCGMTIEAQPIE